MCLRPASPILLQAKENAFILLPQRALLNTLTSLSVTPQFTIRKSVKGDLLITSAIKDAPSLCISTQCSRSCFGVLCFSDGTIVVSKSQLG